jgi:methyl halide transferase
MAAAASSSGPTSEPGDLAPPLTSPTEWTDYHSRWDRIWREGCEPGQMFDKASASPQLLSLLSLPLSVEQQEVLAREGGYGDGAAPPPPPLVDARGKRCFVPGCGRGYDVAAFARAGAAEAVGLELSPAAAAAARDYLRAGLAPSASAGASASAAVVIEGDFFDAAVVGEASFDLGYDLTFLCALHPSMRQRWAEGWARALKRGGTLITACYPIDASRDQNQGPPWPLTPAIYEKLLVGSGLPFRKAHLAPVPRGMSHPSRAGTEWLGLWERV